MSGIFISYRREDSQELAGRLYDRLAQRFGKDRVFRDVDAIDPGANFAEVVGERIGGCDALVAPSDDDSPPSDAADAILSAWRSAGFSGFLTRAGGISEHRPEE